MSENWESKYKALAAASRELSRMRVKQKKIDDKNNQRIKQWVRDALLTDGAHHKQWYLEKIAAVIGAEVEHQPGIAP